MTPPLLLLTWAVLGWLPLSFTTQLPGVAPIDMEQVATVPARAVALNPTQVANVAEQISVRIDGQAPGSGVLLAKQGQTYFVLTAAHVVATPDEYEVITPNGKKYKVNYAQVRKLQGVDLAVVQFTSAGNYQLAQLGNSSQVQRGSAAFVAGWPAGGTAITNPTLLFQQGIISANSQVQQTDGYGLVYTNNTLPGMSGGPVLNSQGELIGIHGKGETERQQGTQVSQVVVKVGYNLGVPINTFLNLAPRAGINLPLTSRPAPTPVAAANVSRPSQVDDFIAEGSNKLHKGDYPGAITALDRAIVANPSAADAYRMRAAARLSTFNWNGEELRSPRNRQEVLAAQSDIDQAVRLDSTSSEAFAIRGFVRLNLKNESGAREDTAESLRLNPNNAPAYIVSALIKIENRDFRGAIADVNTAIERDPNSPYISFAYYNRGYARARLNDFQGAMQDFTRTVQISPRNPMFLGARGAVRGRLGDIQGGLADLQKAADLAVEQNNSAIHKEVINYIQQLRMRQGLGL